MAITFVAAGAWTQSASANITPPMPAGIATNDILILVINGGYNSGSIPAQWTLLQTFTGENTDAVYWLRYTGSQTAQAIPWVAGNLSGRVFAFRGCVTSGTPSSTNAILDNVTSVTQLLTTAITVAVGSAVVFCACIATGTTGSAGYSTWSSTLLTLAEISDNSSLITGSTTSIGVAWGVTASAGSTGTTKVNIATSPGDTILFDLLAAGAVVPIPQLPRMVRQAVARAASY